ncbi:MAG: hypothetical protein HY901_12910 [Deltaproteobacteria bacterium]|nr:hypothetical protein [Deltaproteobacteria bacterium]
MTLRSFVEDSIPREKLEGLALPAEVSTLLREPPLNSAWIPEVSTWATLLAIRDLLGFDDGAWLAWFEPRNRQALTNPVLRLVMNFSSPEVLLPLSQAYWAMTHKGSKLTIVERASHALTLALEYPPGLFDREVASTLTVSFSVPLRLSRARSATVTLKSWAPTHSMFQAEWE